MNDYGIIPLELFSLIYQQSLPYMKCIIRRLCHHMSLYPQKKYGKLCVIDVAASHGETTLVEWLYRSGTPLLSSTLSATILNKHINTEEWLRYRVKTVMQHFVDYIAGGTFLGDDKWLCRCNSNLQKQALHNGFQSHNFDVLMRVIHVLEVDRLTDLSIIPG